MTQNELTRITVHVQPNARQNQVVGFQEGILQLKIAAPPVKGKANQELVNYLSSLLGISRSALTIERGLTGRTKIIAIRGLGHSQVLKLLEKYL